MDAAKILVVDDQPDIVEMITTLLERRGHTCRSAMTGHEAVTVAAAYEPEVVFLDLGLPDITGYEVALALRSLPGGERIYIAAVTGWGQPEDQRRSFDAGINEHLVKPVSVTRLDAVVSKRRSRRR